MLNMQQKLQQAVPKIIMSAHTVRQSRDLRQPYKLLASPASTSTAAHKVEAGQSSCAEW